jgi:hypothetical protein
LVVRRFGLHDIGERRRATGLQGARNFQASGGIGLGLLVGGKSLFRGCHKVECLNHFGHGALCGCAATVCRCSQQAARIGNRAAPSAKIDERPVERSYGTAPLNRRSGLKARCQFAMFAVFVTGNGERRQEGPFGYSKISGLRLRGGPSSARGWVAAQG